MGKSSNRKKKSTQTPTPSVSPAPPPATTISGTSDLDPSLFLRRAHELKEEGNRHFQSKDYTSALQSYDHGLKLLPRAHPYRAVLHSNRAACLMQVQPIDYQAVADECSLALQAQPNFPRALLRRARALDALKRRHLALNDVETLLSVDPTNKDALELAKKLKDSVLPAQQGAVPPPENLPSRPSPAALGASAVRGAPIAGLGLCLPSRSVPKKPTSPPAQPVLRKPASPEKFPVAVLRPEKVTGKVVEVKVERVQEVVVMKWRPLKLVYDHDIRLSQMPENCSFRVLREAISKRFPSSKAVLVKYKDEDGDLVTVTSTAELRLAELIADKAKKEEDDSSKSKNLAVLRLHVVEVSPEQEPEMPEEEEIEKKPAAEYEGLVKGYEILSNSSTEDHATSEEEVQSKKKDEKKDCDHAECKEVEIDDWLYDFAQLFRQQVGIDPDAHLDLHELGMELCSEALEESVTSEDAQSLFKMAAAKFQEVAALAFCNWGNVHMCAARKKIPLDESSSKETMAAQLHVAYDWVREMYVLAGDKYAEALKIKPDFYEGLLALGQQHFETAKLHWSFALANKIDLKTWDYSETINLFDSAEEKMKSATEMWEKVEEQRLNELKDPNLSKKEELLKRRKKQGASADGLGELSAEEAAEQANVMRSQIHLFWGNMLFERSQVEFKLGFGDWKKNFDKAVERFKLAGASETDISVVLKNHASNESGTSMECDEKKVTSLSNGTSETNANGEDKHVLEK